MNGLTLLAVAALAFDSPPDQPQQADTSSAPEATGAPAYYAPTFPSAALTQGEILGRCAKARVEIAKASSGLDDLSVVARQWASEHSGGQVGPALADEARSTAAHLAAAQAELAIICGR